MSCGLREQSIVRAEREDEFGYCFWPFFARCARGGLNGEEDDVEVSGPLLAFLSFW